MLFQDQRSISKGYAKKGSSIKGSIASKARLKNIRKQSIDISGICIGMAQCPHKHHLLIEGDVNSSSFWWVTRHFKANWRRIPLVVKTSQTQRSITTYVNYVIQFLGRIKFLEVVGLRQGTALSFRRDRVINSEAFWPLRLPAGSRYLKIAMRVRLRARVSNSAAAILLVAAVAVSAGTIQAFQLLTERSESRILTLRLAVGYSTTCWY